MYRRTVLTQAAFGFIGLGQMGARMAPNMFKNAQIDELVVFDTNPSAGAELQKAVGATAQNKAVKVTVASSAAEVAQRTKQLLTILPDGPAVRSVYEKEIIPNVQPGSIVVDSTTIDPATPLHLHAALSAKNVQFFDAPVSGGVGEAAAATLSFTVGAPSHEQFLEVKERLQYLAKSVVHCGTTGTGQVAKLSINLMLGQHMVAVSEAMLLGTRLGMDPVTLAGIFNTSTGRCWSSDTYNPYPGVIPTVPASNGYKGGFGASLMLKDITLALEEVKRANLDAQGALTAHRVYTAMVENPELKSLDFSAVLKFIDETQRKTNERR